MSLVHDILKIRYSEEGYLPDYPYHLVSDAEMCDAFMHIVETEVDGEVEYSFDGTGYFFDHYYLDDDTLQAEYKTLLEGYDDGTKHINGIQDYILECYKSSSEYVLPDWVYSYMLGEVIGPVSDTRDIHDLLVLMGIDNIDDIFSTPQEQSCYHISSGWISKYEEDEERPATMFGEPHVIKSVRIQSAALEI